MNTGARLGLAVAAGYVLGRFHKMKWALAVASLAGRGRLPGGSGGLLQQGAKVLISSPEVTKLTEEMRGRLIDAGKAAAVAAVSSKLDSLSEGLRERTDAMQATSAAGGAAGARERHEDERYRDEDRERHEDERHRDDVPRPRRRPDEGDRDRGPAVRRPASRSESGRTRGSGQSRSSDDSAARSSARERQEGGRTASRSSASRTGGDSE